MKRVNYHTHTQLCKHAQGIEIDFVQSAINNKIDILGFSDHAPYPDERYGLRMDYAQLKPHIACLKELQKEYRDKLRICIGLEMEYADSELAYYHELFEKEGLEYLLLGQHIFYTSGGEEMNTYFIEQTGDTGYYIEYAKSLEAGMRSGYFKAVAHPDLFFINDLPIDTNCERACDIIVNAAAATNTVLEFNANGLRREKKQYPDGLRHPYPHKMFWDKVREAKLPVIINSDCHNPKDLWDDTMDRAYELAESWKLNLVDEIPMYRK